MTALENVHDLEGGMREHEEGGRESERENIDSDNTKYLL